MTATARKNKQPAFLNLHERNGHVSLWVNRTLLPGLSTALQKHQHPSLQDLSIACTQVYRRETEGCKNDHCSIQTQATDAINDGSTIKIPGVSMTFHKDILEAASGALMGSKNRAIGKIGLEFREIQQR